MGAAERQPRVMALFLTLTLFQHLIDGFYNRDLRGLVADLLGLVHRGNAPSRASARRFAVDRPRNRPFIITSRCGRGAKRKEEGGNPSPRYATCPIPV